MAQAAEYLLSTRDAVEGDQTVVDAGVFDELHKSYLRVMDEQTALRTDLEDYRKKLIETEPDSPAIPFLCAILDRKYERKFYVNK